MLDYFVATLPHFLAYFGSAVALAAAFLWLYSLCTPHREFALIREGNTAAAVQLTWTFLGFAVPVASVIANSVSLLDMVLWGAVAGVVQLAVFVIISRFLFKAVSDRIAEGCVASGQFVGGIGLGIGILQAACMVP
jgi:putative membrane protein